MRNLVLAVLAVGGFAMTGNTPAEAVGVRHPFCMQGDVSPGLSDCSYNSYEQCQATASGRYLTCIANPYYAGGDYAPAPRGRYRTRSVYPYPSY
jgi:hypothetical protein